MRTFIDLLTIVPQSNLLRELAAMREGVIPFPASKRPIDNLAALRGADVLPFSRPVSEPITSTDVVTRSPVIAHWDFERKLWTVTINDRPLLTPKNLPRYFDSHRAAREAGEQALAQDHLASD